MVLNSDIFWNIFLKWTSNTLLTCFNKGVKLDSSDLFFSLFSTSRSDPSRGLVGHTLLFTDIKIPFGSLLVEGSERYLLHCDHTDYVTTYNHYGLLWKKTTTFNNIKNFSLILYTNDDCSGINVFKL